MSERIAPAIAGGQLDEADGDRTEAQGRPCNAAGCAYHDNAYGLVPVTAYGSTGRCAGCDSCRNAHCPGCEACPELECPSWCER